MFKVCVRSGRCCGRCGESRRKRSKLQNERDRSGELRVACRGISSTSGVLRIPTVLGNPRLRLGEVFKIEDSRDQIIQCIKGQLLHQAAKLGRDWPEAVLKKA